MYASISCRDQGGQAGEADDRSRDRGRRLVANLSASDRLDGPIAVRETAWSGLIACRTETDALVVPAIDAPGAVETKRQTEQADRQRYAAVGQSPPQQGPRPLQPARHRARRPAELPRGLLVGPPFEIAQDDRSPVLFGQMEQFVVEHPAKVATFDLDDGSARGWYSSGSRSAILRRPGREPERVIEVSRRRWREASARALIASR